MDNYKNNKTGEIYTKLETPITNATNAQDGQIMTAYFNDNGNMFVRESNEFKQKFTKYESKREI